MNDPELVVRAFITDYLAWNNSAVADAGPTFDRHLDEAQDDYEKLLMKYCRPTFRGKLSTFGTDPAHDPDKETIAAVETLGTTSVVKTKLVRDMGQFKQVTDYQYHLTFEGGRWYLEQVFYVEGKALYEIL